MAVVLAHDSLSRISHLLSSSVILDSISCTSARTQDSSPGCRTYGLASLWEEATPNRLELGAAEPTWPAELAAVEPKREAQDEAPAHGNAPNNPPELEEAAPNGLEQAAAEPNGPKREIPDEAPVHGDAPNNPPACEEAIPNGLELRGSAAEPNGFVTFAAAEPKREAPDEALNNPPV